MSHFTYREALTAVPTEHGDIGVGIGSTIDGEHRIGVATGRDSDRTDPHMTADQADYLGDTLKNYAAMLRVLGHSPCHRDAEGEAS